MEFICSKEDLARGVQMVERIVSTRSTLPIIGNILFEAKKSGLKLSANNLEIGIELMLSARVNSEGSILVPAKTLGGIVSKLPSGDVTFTVKERGLINIKYKKSNFNIHGLPSDEFPQLSKIKESYSFSIGAGLFSSMLSQTLFAASGSEEKYVLNGALLEVGSSAGEGSNVKLVATDGYRLAKRGAVVNGVDQEFSVIIPSKALQELSRVIASEGGEAVMILASKDQVAFRYKDYYLVSRLIQGQFPDYKRVIPKNLGNKLVMDRKSLLEAAERCSVIASQSANIVRLELKVDGLHIMAQAPDVGSVDEVIEVEVKGKSKAQIAFNVRLLIDSLKAINNEKVSFDVGGPLDPGLIMPVGEDDYVYIVMPIRTQEVATA